SLSWVQRLIDTLAAHKEMCLSQKHLAEVARSGQAGRKTPFLNPAFYVELFRGKLYQAAFQLHVICLAEIPGTPGVMEVGSPKMQSSGLPVIKCFQLSQDTARGQSFCLAFCPSYVELSPSGSVLHAGEFRNRVPVRTRDLVPALSKS
ncbi:mCG66999, partial [Mus musculus]